jgi:hypothetical protein
VLDSADIVRDGDLSRLQQVGLELPDFLSLLTVSPTAIGVALGVRFLGRASRVSSLLPAWKQLGCSAQSRW